MPITPHSTSLYQLGKGTLSIGEWSGTTPPGSYTDVGNCPSLEVEVTEEKLAHYSSRTDTRLKDKEVTLETGYTVNFTLDEIALSNLKIYLKGSLSGVNVIQANTALNKEYAVKFVSNNPVGQDQTWEFWRMTLSPNGAFSLIGEDWATLAFTGEGLADTDNHASSPYFNVTYATTTSTSTTTSSTTTTTTA